MESSNPSDVGRARECGLDPANEPARPSRSSRKRGLSAAPRVDALEARELLSSGAARFLASETHAHIVSRPARHVHKTHQSAATARAAHHRGFPNTANVTPQAAANISPQFGSNPIPALGLTNSAVVRRLFAGGQLGLTLQPPQIPANITTPTPVAPVTPTPVTPPVTTTSAPVHPPTTTTPVNTVTATPPIPMFPPNAQTPPSTGAATSYPSQPMPPYQPTALETAFQNANMKLSNDIQAVQDESQVTPVMTAALRDDYQAIAKAATGPVDPAKSATLQADFQAVGASLPTQAQLSQIKLDFAAMIQSQGVTDSTLIAKTVTDAETVYNASNLTVADMTLLAADGKAVDDANTALNAAYAAANPVPTPPPGSITTTPVVATPINAVTPIPMFPPNLQTPPPIGASTPYPFWPMQMYQPYQPAALETAFQNANTKLGDDLQAVQDKSQVTPLMTAALRDDSLAIDKAGTSPIDPAKLATLRADIQAVGASLPTQAQFSQIKLDLASVIQSRGVTDSTLIAKTVTDAETIYNASNFTAADMTLLAADGKAVDAANAALTAAYAAAYPTPTPPPGLTTIGNPIAVVAPPMPPPSYGAAGMLNGLFAPLTGQGPSDFMAGNSSGPMSRGPMPGGPNFQSPVPANFPPNVQYTVMAAPHVITPATTTTVASAASTTPAQVGAITPA